MLPPRKGESVKSVRSGGIRVEIRMDFRTLRFYGERDIYRLMFEMRAQLYSFIMAKRNSQGNMAAGSE